MNAAGLFVFALLVSWCGTVVIRRHAVRLGLVQTPNHRSSHVLPTPQGGGIGMVVAGTAIGLYLGAGQGAFWWSLIGLSVLIALVGLLDDIWQFSSRLRFSIQVPVFIALVAACAPLRPLSLGGDIAIEGYVLCALAVLAGVWWLNLFNFMDGLDGYAGVQALFMLIAAVVLSAVHSPPSVDVPIWLLALALAAATLGFLFMNWPPACIFMGDVGSTYLALVIFGVALDTIVQGWMTYASWLVLSSVFVVDATLTLLWRMKRGERWSQAHRSHAYQRLSRRFGEHSVVTKGLVALNLLWIGPLAYGCQRLPHAAWIFILMAYCPLIYAAIRIGAGRSDAS